jgi:hypothetical protein
MNALPLRVRRLLLLLAAAGALACSFSGLGLPGEPPTATAVPASPRFTLPPPTASPTAVPPTATAAPTQTPTPPPVNRAATQRAEDTAEQIARIAPDLEQYGLSPEDGGLGWVSEPVTIELDDYGEAQVVVDYPTLAVSDFVVQADITWISTSGLAGCGFLVRADALAGSEYQFLSLRLSGAPVWVLWVFEDGVFAFDAAGYRETQALDVSQGSTNRVALIGQGHRFTVFVNGQDAGSANYNGPTDGAIGLLAKHESGDTSCTFENAWMWILG